MGADHLVPSQAGNDMESGRAKPLTKTKIERLKTENGSGSRIRTGDFQVMSLASYQLLYPAVTDGDYAPPIHISKIKPGYPGLTKLSIVY